VAGSISFSFLVVHRRDENGHRGWLDLSPLAVEVDRGHSQWPDLLLFFLGSPEMAMGDGICSPEVGVG
jgi:hypothetical protein